MFDLRWLRTVHSRLSGIAEMVHRRLRRVVWPVTQAAVAAGVAWYIAHETYWVTRSRFSPRSPRRSRWAPAGSCVVNVRYS